ncbi:MAG: sugar ABC transporter ATP-binding protein [Ancalomicrobiaceae bacterium]|nr:sugar ABC transporter ATP-binding protein [Ancalomicrobiaceae bacterium]
MAELIAAHGISKVFPGVRALDAVDFVLQPGEVHALVGENGAGKSTLIKILMGVYRRDEGTLQIKGRDIREFSPQAAQAAGMAAVYQDISLARSLSVVENFHLGRMPTTRWGTVDWTGANRRCGELLKDLGLDIDPRAPLKSLPVAKQEMIAIAKPVYEGANILVFDEPTALLTNEETEMLFAIIRRLKSEGKGIIYISHRMEEIFAVCDSVTVLKDGRHVKTLGVAETNADELVRLMVGRSMADMYTIKRATPGATALKVEGLTREPRFRNINFDVRHGEIFGLFGLIGSGRTETMRAIFGADPIDSGKLYLDGKATRFGHPSDAIAAGIGFMSEDRKNQSIALPLSVRTNINLANYPAISRFGVVDQAAEREAARSCIERLQIKTPSDEVRIRNLSGGNQQKVVVGKNLTTKARILVCDEPTIGVDVGAKGEIYKIFEALTRDGVAILMVSSYLPEIMGLADRILVLYEGNQMGIVNRDEFDEERLIRLASGLQA